MIDFADPNAVAAFLDSVDSRGFDRWKVTARASVESARFTTDSMSSIVQKSFENLRARRDEIDWDGHPEHVLSYFEALHMLYRRCLFDELRIRAENKASLVRAADESLQRGRAASPYGRWIKIVNKVKEDYGVVVTRDYVKDLLKPPKGGSDP